MAIPTAPPILRARRQNLRAAASWVFIGVIAIGAAIVTNHVTAVPTNVARVTFVNNSDDTIDVAVNDADLSGWINLGPVRPDSTSTVREVVEQGPTWVFRFTGQGVEGGKLVMTRRALVTSRWRVVIPARVIERIGRDARPDPTTEGTRSP